MALALVLLIGAGLMIRSVAAIWNVDPGFRPDNVLTFGLSLPPSMQEATPNAVRTSLRDLSDKLSATPGVQAVSFSAGAVPLQSEDDLFFWLEGQPKPASQSEMNMALVYRVEPGYLKTMGIPLRQGRFFTNQDDERSQRVVVIDEVFARKYFGDTNPVGKRIQQQDEEPQEIVGVVGHVEQWSLDSGGQDELQAQLYEPFRQLSDNGLPTGVGVLVRSHDISGEAGARLFDSIRQLVRAQHSQNVIFRPQTMNEVIAGTLAERHFSMILLDSFAVVALLLASVGLYGVISYLVGQRTQELGIRIALGARSTNVLRLVLAQGMKMALAGVALGLVAAFGLTRLLTNMLFGVSTTDPATFALISFLLISVALMACFIPALRATRVDPLLALRSE
jgi:predicted permease